MTPNQLLDLAAIKARLEKATKGPWETEHWYSEQVQVVMPNTHPNKDKGGYCRGHLIVIINSDPLCQPPVLV